MSLDQPIDITTKHHKTVLALLASHLPNTTTWVYGSRVKWTSSPKSDLDLVVFAVPEQIGQVSNLREAFEESNLSFRVDLFVWDEVPEQFRKQIEAEHVVLVERQELGLGADDWTRYTVEELKSSAPNALATGPFGSAISSRHFIDGGIPVIRGSNLSQDVGTRLNDDGLVFVSESKAKEFSRSLAKPGDLIFTCWGTIDQVGLIDDRSQFQDYVVSNKQMKLTPDPRKASSLFLYYLFSSPLMRDQILNQGIGSSVPGFNLGQLRSMTLGLPPLPEQRSIAHVLGTLDDKIELNRRMNETLEEMARALFRSWFVDFDPVRAKLEGRDAGLPQEIVDLLPDKLVDSELGPIPQGWEVKALDEIAVFQNGLALQKHRPQANEERLPVVKIAHLRSELADRGEWASANIRPECILNDGDVVFSWSGSLMVKIWCGGRAALNQHLFKVTSTRFPKWFFLHNVRSHLADFQTIAAGKATTMGHIKRHHLTDAKCVVPSWEILSAVDNTFSSLLLKMVSLSLESRTLAALRDTLLPKLVSGELRVGISPRVSDGQI